MPLYNPLKRFPFSWDGVTQLTAMPGELVELPPHLVTGLADAGFIDGGDRVAKSIVPQVQAKMLEGSDENKMMAGSNENKTQDDTGNDGENVIVIPVDWETQHWASNKALAEQITGGDLLVPDGMKPGEAAKQVIAQFIADGNDNAGE